MTTTVSIAISIEKALYDRAERLAQQLDLSRNDLFSIALESFIQNSQEQALIDEIHPIHPNVNEHERSLHQDVKIAGQASDGRTAINQGDIYWVPFDRQGGTERGYTHPYVVVQEDVFNHSRIHTVVVCALTSNIKRVNTPGNILLEAGEANLPRQSVVEVSKLSSVDKTQLGEYIGSLDEPRIHQILAGMRFLQRITGPRESGAEMEQG